MRNTELEQQLYRTAARADDKVGTGLTVLAKLTRERANGPVSSCRATAATHQPRWSGLVSDLRYRAGSADSSRPDAARSRGSLRPEVIDIDCAVEAQPRVVADRGLTIRTTASPASVAERCSNSSSMKRASCIDRRVPRSGSSSNARSRDRQSGLSAAGHRAARWPTESLDTGAAGSSPSSTNRRCRSNRAAAVTPPCASADLAPPGSR